MDGAPQTRGPFVSGGKTRVVSWGADTRGKGCDMELTLALAQCTHRADGDSLALVEDWTSRAEEASADMVAFPECLMTPYEKTPEDFAASAQSLDGPFPRGVEAIAREHRMWISYTVNETDPRGGRPFNTAVLADASGMRRLVYRKTHLYNAGSYRESDKMQAGGEICSPVDTPWGKVGLGVCYDLRFPEFARKLALEGCELMLLPAAWVEGPRKAEQFQTLVQARAIENGMFVAGLGRCGGVYCGMSLLAAPDGSIVREAGDGEELLVATIDLAEAEETRAKMPSLRHRRPELY